GRDGHRHKTAVGQLSHPDRPSVLSAQGTNFPRADAVQSADLVIGKIDLHTLHDLVDEVGAWRLTQGQEGYFHGVNRACVVFRPSLLQVSRSSKHFADCCATGVRNERDLWLSLGRYPDGEGAPIRNGTAR